DRGEGGGADGGARLRRYRVRSTGAVGLACLRPARRFDRLSRNSLIFLEAKSYQDRLIEASRDRLDSPEGELAGGCPKPTRSFRSLYF
ncbi:MAG: hypothetical protein KDF56_17585, partial [Ottowia sp.]|nr:hypothetical protein [Ottowia sp.]